MKKAISLILAALLPIFAGCGAAASGKTDTPAATTEDKQAVSANAMEKLDGKRVIFIGNSFTQAANAVLPHDYDELTQKERMGNKGYFYQLCKNAGAEVDVTAWTFGGHYINDIFTDSCTASAKPCVGKNHLGYLTDHYYDYVVFQAYKERIESGVLMDVLEPVMELFREANPNVKFLLLVPHMAVEKNVFWIDQLEELAASGITICNWGAILHDICQKTVEVPGATQPYGRQTFVISVDQKDGYHQNILAGYLTALMTYCAITGDSAVGQPYEFCYDPSVNSRFLKLEDYKAKKYVYETYSNFDAVFRSEPDMKGLQQLVDQYIEKYN